MLRLFALQRDKLSFRATRVFETYDERNEFVALFDKLVTAGTCTTSEKLVKPYAWFEVTFRSDDDVKRYESFMSVVSARSLSYEWGVLDDACLKSREEFLSALLDLSFV